MRNLPFVVRSAGLGALLASASMASLLGMGIGCSSSEQEASSTDASGGGSGSTSNANGSMSSGTGETSTATGGVTCSGTQVACGGGCVDPASFQADVKNCGVCGRDCQGGACEKGACQVTTVYKSEPVTQTMPGKPYGAFGLAVDDTSIYVAGSHLLFSCPKTGGCGTSGENLKILSEPIQGSAWGGPIALDGKKVFGVTNVGGTQARIGLCDLGAGLPNWTSFYTDPANSQGFSRSIVLDHHGYVYWLEHSPDVIKRCPVSGCGPNLENLQIVRSGDAGATSVTGSMAADETGLYLTSGIGKMLKCAGGVCGNNDTSAVALSDKSGASVLAIDEAYVYFNGGAGLSKCPKSGCGPKDENLVVLYTTTPDLAGMPFNIVVDKDGIYWFMATDTAQNPNWPILRCPKSGCGDKNSLAVILATEPLPFNLVTDDKSIYWISGLNIAERTLKRLAK